MRKVNCAVPLCSSPKDATYHVFPKDMNLQRLWVRACKRKDQINTNNAKICSEHFPPEAYERDLRNELLRLPLRKILKPGVVPTLKLSDTPVIIYNNRSEKRPSTTVTDRNAREEKRARTEIVNQLLLSQEVSKPSAPEEAKIHVVFGGIVVEQLDVQIQEDFTLIWGEDVHCHSRQLSSELKSLYANDDTFSDVKIVCKGQVTLKANKVVLAYSSKLVRSIIKSLVQSCDSHCHKDLEIICPDFDPNAMKKVLELIFEGASKLPISDDQLIRQMSSILETLQIKINLPLHQCQICRVRFVLPGELNEHQKLHFKQVKSVPVPVPVPVGKSEVRIVFKDENDESDQLNAHDHSSEDDVDGHLLQIKQEYEDRMVDDLTEVDPLNESLTEEDPLNESVQVKQEIYDQGSETNFSVVDHSRSYPESPGNVVKFNTEPEEASRSDTLRCVESVSQSDDESINSQFPEGSLRIDQVWSKSANRQTGKANRAHNQMKRKEMSSRPLKKIVPKQL